MVFQYFEHRRNGSLTGVILVKLGQPLLVFRSHLVRARLGELHALHRPPFDAKATRLKGSFQRRRLLHRERTTLRGLLFEQIVRLARLRYLCLKPRDLIELAIRTLQVGALAYPFFRNHAGSSDGYFLPSNISGVPVPPLARAAITLRYNLLPHLYSLFVDVSRRGGTIVTPLAFEFPAAGVARVSTQFMLGGLMVCPVLAATLLDNV